MNFAAQNRFRRSNRSQLHVLLLLFRSAGEMHAEISYISFKEKLVILPFIISNPIVC